MTKKPVYPDLLKQENWRKSKGFIANIAGGGETGIGTAMRQLEEAYNNVNWVNLDYQQTVRNLSMGRTEPGFTYLVEAQVLWLGEGTNVAKLQSAALRLAAVVRPVVNAWAGNKVMPNDNIRHIKDVLAAAEAFDDVCGSLKSTDEYQSILSQIHPDQNQFQKDQVRGYFDALLGYVMRVEVECRFVTSVAPHAWGSFRSGTVRGLGGTLNFEAQVHPELEHYRQLFKPFTLDEYSDKVTKEGMDNVFDEMMNVIRPLRIVLQAIDERLGHRDLNRQTI